MAPLLVMLFVLVASTVYLVARSNRVALPGGVREYKGIVFDGQELTPILPAPPLVGRDSVGQRVDLAADRGKAVLVTFLYTHCPTLCPLITADLRTTLAELGRRASGVRIIAVSVDPTGDTPSAVRAFLAAFAMTGRIQYVIGSAATLSSIWAAWPVGASRDAGSPDIVAHNALVYGVSAKGKLLTVYAPNFAPSDIIHDLPGLLAS